MPVPAMVVNVLLAILRTASLSASLHPARDPLFGEQDRVDRVAAGPRGGPGRFRGGGLGGERIFTVVVPAITLSAVLNRMNVAPLGALWAPGRRDRRQLHGTR